MHHVRLTVRHCPYRHRLLDWDVSLLRDYVRSKSFHSTNDAEIEFTIVLNLSLYLFIASRSFWSLRIADANSVGAKFLLKIIQWFKLKIANRDSPINCGKKRNWPQFHRRKAESTGEYTIGCRICKWSTALQTWIIVVTIIVSIFVVVIIAFSSGNMTLTKG